MYCRKCGASIPDEAKFCPKCGATLGKKTEIRAEIRPEIAKPVKKKSKKIIPILIVAIIVIVAGEIYYKQNFMHQYRAVVQNEYGFIDEKAS